jgi:hypothetical protein
MVRSRLSQGLIFRSRVFDCDVPQLHGHHGFVQDPRAVRYFDGVRAPGRRLYPCLTDPCLTALSRTRFWHDVQLQLLTTFLLQQPSTPGIDLESVKSPGARRASRTSPFPCPLSLRMILEYSGLTASVHRTIARINLADYAINLPRTLSFEVVTTTRAILPSSPTTIGSGQRVVSCLSISRLCAMYSML